MAYPFLKWKFTFMVRPVLAMHTKLSYYHLYIDYIKKQDCLSKIVMAKRHR